MIETDLHKHDLPRLENATRYAAKIVMDLGDDYWPLFERLERELKELKGRKARLQEFQ